MYVTIDEEKLKDHKSCVYMRLGVVGLKLEVVLDLI